MDSAKIIQLINSDMAQAYQKVDGLQLNAVVRGPKKAAANYPYLLAGWTLSTSLIKGDVIMTTEITRMYPAQVLAGSQITVRDPKGVIITKYLVGEDTLTPLTTPGV